MRSDKVKDRGFTRTPGIWVYGFTLVELIVVITIATAIMTALVIKQNNWNNSLAVKTQAYEMALMIRQAQIYSLGVKEYTAATTDKFDVGYGLHVDTNGAVFDRYVFFVDKNKNHIYDSGEAVEEKRFTRGVKVFRVCATTLTPSCGAGSSPTKEVDISFLRPDPKANLVFLDNSGTVLSPQPAGPAFLRIRSADGTIESVITIESNGQISIQ